MLLKGFLPGTRLEPNGLPPVPQKHKGAGAQCFEVLSNQPKELQRPSVSLVVGVGFGNFS